MNRHWAMWSGWISIIAMGLPDWTPYIFNHSLSRQTLNKHDCRHFHVASSEFVPFLCASAMEALQAALLCRVCCGMPTAAMLVKSCGHHFCSLCIRRWMDGNTLCPVCRGPLDELIRLRLVDDLALAFEAIPPVPVQQEQTKEIRDESKQPPGFVQCPICSDVFQQHKIEAHAELCLLRPSKSEKPVEQQARLAAVAYNLLSDKQVRQLLQEHTLSTKGKRADLIRRHKEFVARYNANLDARRPKPTSSIVQETHNMDRILSSSSRGIQSFFSTSGSAKKQDPFRKLIREYRKRNPSSRRPKRPS